MLVAILLGVAYVAYGSIEPYVQDLALGALNGNGYTPIQVAAHGAGLKTHVKPALALSIDIGTPLFVLLQYPFFKPLLILLQRQVPVCCLLHYGLAAAYGADRVDELCG